VTQPAWRLMKENGYGRVVMTCSSSGMFAHQGMANYAAAKAGIYGLCKALAYEGRDHGIRVNAVLPGAATTISESDPIPGFDVDWSGRSPGGSSSGGRSWGDIFETLAPRRTAEAVAPLVSFLASRACPVSGEAFVAMAGWYGRVFVGKASGWVAPNGHETTAEDILEHWSELRDLSSYTVPADTFEDMDEVAEAIKAL
jgi:NAD(P)-dependent dehydrogenase (short-subunit alcohol dehydrogenase family)